jgi:hypothetical protein
MNTYLKKIAKETGIKIELQRIIRQNLCKINKHYMQFPYKRNTKHIKCPIHDKIIYHQHLFYLSPRYFNTHLGNTLSIDNMLYKTCQNPPLNVIFVEYYKDAKEEDNYFLGTFLPYLESPHCSRLSVPPLWRTILLAPLEVSMKMMLNSRCCLKNAPLPIMLHDL